MVQPTHNRKSDHLVPCILSGRNRSALFRDLLPNPLMRPCLVEVHHIRIEHAARVASHEKTADGRDIVAVHSWRSARRSHWLGEPDTGLEQLDATGRCHPEEIGSKLAIIITYQILGSLPIGSRFPELLGHPGIGRRSRDADVEHLPRLQFDEEEGKKRAKEEVAHLQEVTSPDLCSVSAQKGGPPLSSWLVGANRPHVFLNGSFADMDAQFQEFSANPLSAPEAILPGHLPDQGDGFCGDLRRIRSRLGLALPVQAKKLSMPAQ